MGVEESQPHVLFAWQVYGAAHVPNGKTHASGFEQILLVQLPLSQAAPHAPQFAGSDVRSVQVLVLRQ